MRCVVLEILRGGGWNQPPAGSRLAQTPAGARVNHRSRSRSRSRRSRYIFPGAGAGAAEQFCSEPECFPGAGAGAGADQKCHGSASLVKTNNNVYSRRYDGRTSDVRVTIRRNCLKSLNMGYKLHISGSSPVQNPLSWWISDPVQSKSTWTGLDYESSGLIQSIPYSGFDELSDKDKLNILLFGHNLSKTQGILIAHHLQAFIAHSRRFNTNHKQASNNTTPTPRHNHPRHHAELTRLWPPVPDRQVV